MLYLVATPIGNLKDITLRAVEVLQSVDVILAEDTRRAKILLKRYKIPLSKLQSFHEHSSDSKISWVLDRLKQNKRVALVTDGGTPGISDPGGKLISLATNHQLLTTPIPGPSALTAILSVTGWSNEPVLYLGYLPKKKGRQKLIGQIAGNVQIAQTAVLFESPYRIIKTLNDLKSALGDKQVVVGRELTKVFEDIFHGTFTEAIDYFAAKQRGEFTVAVKLD